MNSHFDCNISWEIFVYINLQFFQYVHPLYKSTLLDQTVPNFAYLSGTGPKTEGRRVLKAPQY